MKILFLSLLVLFLTACSPEQSPVEQGEKLFKQTHIGKNKVIGCIACHSIKPNQIIIGPSLAGLSLRAPYLVAGQSAQEYIKNSIINPDSHIVDGYLPAVMFSGYSQELSEEEINYIVEYLVQL